MAGRLPIHELEGEIVARLRESRRLVLSAPTGAGKSTQVPQMLLRHGLLDRGQVVVLQPRRIAARLLATRVASELGVPLGREVGYQVRFESVCGPETKIRFVTEGILLRQLIDDPELKGVAAILFDEFHERHLYGDVTLARALELRSDLLISVMSATLEGDRLEAYLKPCARLVSQGRLHPVAIEYESGKAPVWDRAADAFARCIEEGDALIFMPGAYEIARTIEAIRARPESRGFDLLPLHGELPPAEQDAAVAPGGRRKVVVATNVAETSLTIEGVRLVIDSGFARIPRHDPNRGINTLFVEKVSRASADQRAGRAGRTAPGRCVRLWEERETRAARETPEVMRLELSEVVLALKATGVADLRKFRWLDAPEEKSLAHAEGLLRDLGALEGDALTGLGRRMTAFPLHPRYARLLLAAGELGCVREAALVAALTQGRDLMLRRVDPDTAEFRDERFGEKAPTDFSVLMKAWSYAVEHGFRVDACDRAGIHAQSARQVGPLLDQFLRIAERQGLDVSPRKATGEALRKCLLIAFSDRVARRLDEGTLRCELVHGRRGLLARESAVRHAPLLVAAEVREVEGKGGAVSTILSLATAIEPEWLRELYAGEIGRRTRVAFDGGAKRVVAEEEVCFRGLVLESRSVEPPAEEAARLLAAEVLEERLPLKSWDAAVDQWLLRVSLVARECPELGIAAPDRRAIVERLCRGAASWKEVKDRPVLPVARSLVDAEKIEANAPERLELSNGRRAKLTYGAEGATLAAKIQDLYGVTAVPRIAMGRVAPVVQILAPSNRPVQTTQDLAGFWREHYPRLKKELQRKYPKHEWREVPTKP